MPAGTDLPDDSKKFVVCIPEDLELPLDQRDVLSHGLRLVPSPKHVDEDGFYIRWRASTALLSKLHAFFNDPNKGFINPGSEADDDPFMKYKWKTSNWTRSSNPACVERFIERCKDEI